MFTIEGSAAITDSNIEHLRGGRWANIAECVVGGPYADRREMR